MDYTNHNTSLRTNKHLSYEERFYIEKQLLATLYAITCLHVMQWYPLKRYITMCTKEYFQ